MLQPLASGLAVLTEEEREMGVVLADIGGGTTDVAIFIEGSIWHTVILSSGGSHITNDIAVGLQMPFSTAEEIKIRYGHACRTPFAVPSRSTWPRLANRAGRTSRVSSWPRSSRRVRKRFST